MSEGLKTERDLGYSVVVPAFNEAESLQELHAELSPVMEALGEEYEILFVDDGSTDATPGVLKSLRNRDDRVKGLRFPRNVGKSAAYSEAFYAARGRVIVTLDADLQDDPAEIPGLVERLGKECDLVVGWKKGRLENEPLKKIPSRFFNLMLSSMFSLKIHDSNSGFRAMTSAVSESLGLYGNLYRFIPQLASIQGFSVAEHPVRHRKRKYGKSKYGGRRFWTGLLDLLTVRFITTYAPQRPLHFFGTLGLVPFLAGVGLETYVLVDKLSGGNFQKHVAAIIVGVMLMIIGFQCIITGLVGEMISAQGRYSPRGGKPGKPSLL